MIYEVMHCEYCATNTHHEFIEDRQDYSVFVCCSCSAEIEVYESQTDQVQDD